MARALALVCVALAAVALARAAKPQDVAGVVKGALGHYEFEHDGNKFWVLEDPKSGRVYYVNQRTNTPQWSDPRDGDAEEPELAGRSKRATDEDALWPVMAVATVPILALTLAIVARIWYLQTYYPDLLWPTKVRKVRQARQALNKPQKARGKMNQDGKGGRSANS